MTDTVKAVADAIRASEPGWDEAADWTAQAEAAITAYESNPPEWLRELAAQHYQVDCSWERGCRIPEHVRKAARR